MSQLFFKKEYRAAIREGRKRTTIRRWDRPRVTAGKQAFSPGLGWLMIEAVDAVTLDALGHEDAQADGFNNLTEMTRALQAIYPDSKTDGKSWFRIRFHVQAPSVPQKAS